MEFCRPGFFISFPVLYTTQHSNKEIDFFQRSLSKMHHSMMSLKDFKKEYAKQTAALAWQRK
jgi:hypothetical protein